MDNLLPAAKSAGVGHAVVLSIVGANLVPDLVSRRPPSSRPAKPTGARTGARRPRPCWPGRTTWCGSRS
jgi:hypothetical protein